MATQEFIKSVIEHVKDNRDKIAFNNSIFEIMEGDLMKYVEITLRRQLSKDNVDVALERAAPINIWNKIVKKLSKLYSSPPSRTTENPADQELVDYYVNDGIDRHFGNMNENYNAYKWSTLELFEDEIEKRLRARSVPSNQFIAYSNDPVDPLRVTAIVKFMGLHIDKNNVKKEKFFIYTKDEFISVLEDGTLVNEDLDSNGGVNPYRVLTFEYVAMSEYMLVPMPDRDTFKMSVLIPVLITDQNFGSLFLSVPIIYAVDAGLEKLPVSPNMFVNIKSQDIEKQAQIGVVKAEPNLDAQMQHVKNQLAMWLETRDIKAGTIGKLDGDNFSSGISKIISEMDTLENRKMQEIIFKDVEKKFWKRLAKMHNELAKVGRISNRQMFSDPEKLEVHIDYAEDMVIESRVDQVGRLRLEVESGFNSKKRAVKEYKGYNDEQFEQLLEEIDNEKVTTVVVVPNKEEENDK